MKEPRQIVRLALITEKGAMQREKLNQYIFEVDPLEVTNQSPGQNEVATFLSSH